MENQTNVNDLHKPMSLARKTLFSAGGLALLAGLVKPGTLAKSHMVDRLHVRELKNTKDRIVSKYKTLIDSINESKLVKDKALDKAWILKETRKSLNKGLHGGEKIDKQTNMVQEIVNAEHEISKNRDNLAKTLPWATRNLDKLDTILPIIGGMSIAGGLMNKNASSDLLSSLKEKSKKKAERLNKHYNSDFSEANVGLSKLAKTSINATKESEMPTKPYPENTNLLRVPVNYTKGFQCGPIIENASKMDKIAQAVNELFPKVPTDPRDKIIEKQTKKLDKKDEALAMHEQAHMEKDQKLKELQKAIKQVNGQAQKYREKAIEHFTNSLDAEVTGTPGR